MTRVAIVGSSGGKLDSYEKFGAMKAIIKIIKEHQNPTLISGRSPLGGIDVLAEMYADEFKIPKLIFPPVTENWEGYKNRNLAIAAECDVLYCITTRRKKIFCYHCKDGSHEKSGGCWTMKKAKEMGKPTKLIVLH